MTKTLSHARVRLLLSAMNRASREIRTPDPLVRSQVPYPLGHGDVVEGDGFEPPQQMSFGTPALTWRTPP